MIYIDHDNGQINRVAVSKLDDSFVGFKTHPADIMIFGCIGKYQIENNKIVEVEGWTPPEVEEITPE